MSHDCAELLIGVDIFLCLLLTDYTCTVGDIAYNREINLNKISVLARVSFRTFIKGDKRDNC